MKQRIAVIGAGIGGITAAHLLQQKFEVTLFEAAAELGGHAHHENLDVDGKNFSVDTAFLIFNEHTYKTFGLLLEDLGIRDAIISAEMSSCFSDPEKGFDYTLGAGFKPFLAKPKSLLRSEFYLIVRDLFRFRKQAVTDIDSGRDLSGITAGKYLENYSAAFRENLVWPLTSAIWSLADGQMQDYPISTLFDYFDNHQLLRGKSEKKWKTFQGSSAVYVKAFEAKFSGSVQLNTRVSKITRKEEGVLVNGELFEYAILATHADTSLKLLETPTNDESRLLGAWRYQDNPVVLHHDVRVLNPDPRLWGSWNMKRQDETYQISYYLNRLQNLPVETPVVLTLGEPSLDASKVLKRFSYRHPIFDSQSVATQSELASLNKPASKTKPGQIFFCGSYFGHGFHEDACRSAANVARALGCDFVKISSDQK